jgi:hypothetical protein
MKGFLLSFAVLCLFTTAQALDYDFEDKRQLNDWEVVGGDWKIQDGTLRGQHAPAAGGAGWGPGILIGEDTWSDYELEFKMMVEKGISGGPGPVIRYQDPQNWYYFETWNGKFFLRPRVVQEGLNDGAPDPIPGTVWEQADFPGDGKWHDIKISAKGEDIAGWVDGKQVWKYTFNKVKWGRPAGPIKKGLLTGRVGFTTWNAPESVGFFDDFKLEGPGIKASPVSPRGKLATMWGEIKDSN